MFTRRSLIAVARVAARNVDRSVFVATDFSDPFSKAAIRSDSSGSVFGILLTLAQVVWRTASQHYGAIRAALEKVGRPIGVNDLPIAAHARSEGLTLVSNNLGDFKRVPGLLTENWLRRSRA